jgi:hypothetical protein
MPVVPLRRVLVRDPKGKLDPRRRSCVRTGPLIRSACCDGSYGAGRWK